MSDDQGWAASELEKMRKQSERPIRSLMPVPDLPRCPYCASTDTKPFNPDWIEAPRGARECRCGNAFVPDGGTATTEPTDQPRGD